MGLDYAGVDFGLDAAGTILVFEANATMAVYPPGDEEMWTYRRRAVDRVIAAVRDDARRARQNRRIRMKSLIVFDLDGTFAESKSAIDAEMATLLA